MMVYAFFDTISTSEGADMATLRLTARRLLLASACSIALAAAPAAALVTGHGTALAQQCPGSINIGVLNEGAPVAPNCGTGAVGPMPITSGAPSQQTLTQCSGIPGCLSNALYGPGNVSVPKPNTTVQQSQ